MSIDRKEITSLMSSGISAFELLEGVEIDEGGIVGLSHYVKARSPQEKRDVLYSRAKQLIQTNREPNGRLTRRNILQHIGGGELKEGEWLQVSETPNKSKLVITGTRGVFTLDN